MYFNITKKKKNCYSQKKIIRTFYKNDMVVGFPYLGLEIIAQAKGWGWYKNFPLA